MSVKVEYDLTYLNRIASGDNTFITEMLETFINTTPEFLENINLAIQTNDIDDLYHQIHKFVANVQFIGLMPTLKKLKEFEMWIQEKKNTELYNSTFNEIANESNEAIKILKSDFNLSSEE